MLPSAEPLLLSILGIDNAFEASGLIRLFHAAEPVPDPAPDQWRETVLPPYPWVIRLVVTREDGWFDAQARVFHHGRLSGRGALRVRLANKTDKGALLLGSAKLAAGTALYHALAEAFNQTLPWGSLTGVRPVKLASGLLEAGHDDAAHDDVAHDDAAHDDAAHDDAAAQTLLEERTGMSRDKAALLLSVAHHEQPYLQIPDHSASVYVGIPFCATRCLYCSFPAYDIHRMGHMVSGYLDALERELMFLGAWLAQSGTRLSTVYIGGGTPTALDEAALDRLLTMMADHLPLGEALEYTVEAGRPDTLTPEKLRRIKAAGATRISINPQSMNDDTLRRVGRVHTAGDVTRAFAMAREAGFSNINADLIAGLPGESLADFQRTLARMTPLAPESLTVHTLAVKRASRLHEQESGAAGPARTDDATVAAMVAEAATYATQQGLRPYYLYRQKNILANLENIGYARPGMGCRYNVETMSERQTILAAGSGAITKVSHNGRQLERVFNVRELRHYVERIDEMVEKKRELLSRHFPDTVAETGAETVAKTGVKEG
jgi:oxygen-independent coproporphyrinogen-3 oxidase